MYNGLVLSGGGSKGLLQLGFLEALYENKKIEKIERELNYHYLPINKIAPQSSISNETNQYTDGMCKNLRKRKSIRCSKRTRKHKSNCKSKRTCKHKSRRCSKRKSIHKSRRKLKYK